MFFLFLDCCDISFCLNLPLAICIKTRDIFFQQWKLLASLEIQERQIKNFSLVIINLLGHNFFNAFSSTGHEQMYDVPHVYII